MFTSFGSGSPSVDWSQTVNGRLGKRLAGKVLVLAGSECMDCTFCHLIRDDAARWVARGPVAGAFAPQNPLAPGHTLVIPTAHWADIFEVPPGDLAHTMALVQQVAAAMRTALKAGGVNVLNASGPGSEQSVPHLHFHVVPRWLDDAFSTWPTKRSRHQIADDPVTQLADAMPATHAR
ncbi:HIT family protein [Streptomyces luridiscabiei]|uniref:HIT family protein n=1 Tax=Streptomyces luridiscabiei TaxID=164114 RepID=UPI002D21AC4C|nr:HIT domain-containing protein [Streptomyces luridiscabiei]